MRKLFVIFSLLLSLTTNSSDCMREGLSSPHWKAEKFNRESMAYGILSEVGAGLPTFNLLQSALNTSKTVYSAYSPVSKESSLSEYGATNRFVSRNRLLEMLNHDTPLLLEEILRSTHPQAKFFAFANTVSTGKEIYNPHGWMGLRFQASPQAIFNTVLLHFYFRNPPGSEEIEPKNVQQSNLGQLGINLLHSCYFSLNYPELFVKSLMDNVNPYTLQIDFLEFSGPAFKPFDANALALQLVKNQQSRGMLFLDGKLIPLSEGLFQTPLIVLENGTPYGAPLPQNAKKIKYFINPDNKRYTPSETGYELFLNRIGFSMNDYQRFTGINPSIIDPR